MLSINSAYDFEFLYSFYIKFVAETLLYLRNFALYISVWVLGYLLVCCVVYRRYARRLPTRTRGALRAKRVLIVVAHPDDECMFFGPTIFRLCEQGADVYLRCLSNVILIELLSGTMQIHVSLVKKVKKVQGAYCLISKIYRNRFHLTDGCDTLLHSFGNYEGKGETRKQELWSACQELGVPPENICLVMDTRLRDDPKLHWPVSVIAKLMQHDLEALEIDTLVTFDRGGVSSHANHSAIFYAVAYMFVEKLMPKRCTVYTLDSVSILRKYLSFLDIPLSFVLSSKRYFLRWSESRRIVRAMKQHRSQMVWFRYLYVLFSRYMVINTLRRISLADIELELEVDD